MLKCPSKQTEKHGVHVLIKSEPSCPGVTTGGAWDMMNRDDWLQRGLSCEPEILLNTWSVSFTKAFFFFLNVGKCKRINTQIISRQERTKVSLSDKCLPNLNARKCQVLNRVWCLKESSLLILFHALHHEKFKICNQISSSDPVISSWLLHTDAYALYMPLWS